MDKELLKLAGFTDEQLSPLKEFSFEFECVKKKCCKKYKKGKRCNNCPKR
jgi:hypothetical protein